MPTSVKLPPSGQRPSVVQTTSRPQSATPVLGIQRRQWNPPPLDLFPTEPPKRTTRTPRTPKAHAVAQPTPPSSARTPVESVSNKQVQPRASVVNLSPNRPRTTRRESLATADLGKEISPQRRASVVSEAQLEALQRGATKRMSQVTWARLHKAAIDDAPSDIDMSDRADTKTNADVVHNQRVDSVIAERRDAIRSALVTKSMKKQGVDTEDIRPLIEIAYWSPFLEVRRDAAAALASLSRNPANLDLLSNVGALGALLSMLNATDNKVDPAIARDCAQAIACMVKLHSVKLKLLQAPDGIECIFTLLHSPDFKLRTIAFELVKNLVTIEDLRQAIAKREGFAYMLDSCRSKDSRVRLLAASILNNLAESRENRFLFYHSTHFQTLADILHDPFLEKDVLFRRELLSFIQLLVTEEDNGRKFVELHLVPTLLLIVDSPRSNHAICLLVVSILESLSRNRRNHSALVTANALPRIVQLCFCGHRTVLSLGEITSSPGSPPRRARPSTAGSTFSRRTTRVASPPVASHGGDDDIRDSDNLKIPVGTQPPSTLRASVAMSAEMNALLRPAFAIFCEMAKNTVNRDHIIRSKLIDYIAARNLYASSDKRVRRSVITLLTALICKERERDRRGSAKCTPTLDQRSITGGIDEEVNSDTLNHQQDSDARNTNTATASQETEFKHYIELLARGIVKCLFGILSGNDFSMKVDAIAAIAQLTDDEHSRLTMCKPQLLQSLKEFAFHPLIQTRTNIAKIIANFAERPENILKLVDEGMLTILVKYVCPISRNNDVLVEATRAIAAMSKVHVTRNKLVECGVLGTLIQFSKSPSTTSEVRTYAAAAIRNLRHDAAALLIQSIYRGWCIRVHHARAILTRKRRIRRMTSIMKIQTDQAIATVMERLVAK
ncbi:hypothetical protein Poli38472_003292 [Pythium oligandrum]|uniref:Vacuolar protein 8 n=1 Tax=Pythium oligandrum TaxID=41045 RepID=A0A8K1C6C8_PYTOL|nr:hypothetical protein Poli38472_003292 [Pythium oligandrum]|eukprot:TMW57367.1 hypothetical protein Poli38472_003292 [Pythium oligandrum]